MTLSDEELTTIIKKIGPPNRGKNPRIALDLDRIRLMDREGFSDQQIAEYFDVSRWTIRRRLKGNHL